MKLLFALVTVMVASAPANAQGFCSTQTIRGSWGITCEGYLTPGPNASLVPARILGTAVSSADGVFTGEATVSLGGVILPQKVVGTAIVSDNCTGTIRYTQTIAGAPAPDLNIRFLIFDNGKLIQGLAVDPGSNLSCTLKRMW